MTSSSLAAVPVRLVLADDQATVRQGVRALFDLVPGVRTVAEVDTTEALLHCLPTLAPDVLIMDLSMPTLGGLSALRRVAEGAPATAVVVLTRYADPALVRAAFAAGAAAYVLKRSGFAELRLAVAAALRGERYCDQQLDSSMVAAHGAVAGVSAREDAVLRRAAHGHSNKEIAVALSISVRTVEAHNTHGMRKLGLRDRGALVRYATVQRWLAES